MIYFLQILQKEITIKITDKDIAKTVGIGAVTFSRWKKERPKLYNRIKKSFECEEALEKLGVTLDEAKEAIAAYKDHLK